MRLALGSILLCVVAGCNGSGDSSASYDASPDGAAPVSAQIVRLAPDLRDVRFTNLLSFESPSDNVFVATSGVQQQMDGSQAHTGRSSLRLSGRSGKMTVKLSTLMSSSQPFPGEWALAGAYFYSTASSQVLVACEIGGTTVAKTSTSLPSGQWCAAMVDLTNLLDPNHVPTGAPTLTFTIDSPNSGQVWCDDVMLVDNTKWIVGLPETAAAGKWTVSRRGLRYLCGVSDSFAIGLMPAELQPDGWKLEEANTFRARFSSTGREKFLTIFPDGRSYRDGNFRPLSSALRSDPIWADQQNAPGIIEIPETMGRLERRTIGDENNDGYNEARASYMITATGPRLELTLTPRSTPLLRPMIEISGMPQGDALVTVEGTLVEHKLRLDDGTILIEIPGRIDRATTVNVRIQ